MRPRVDLVFLGLLIVVLGPVANLGATERGMNALKQKARTAGLPTRTDPQGTIGGGVGEFGGPPGPTAGADARTAKKRGSGVRQDKDGGQKEQGHRLGSCHPG